MIISKRRVDIMPKFRDVKEMWRGKEREDEG